MGLAQYSQSNLENTVALYLAQQLLTAGYLLYWKATDAAQTPDGWYYGFLAQQAFHFANPPFSTRFAASKGLMTLKPESVTIPEYPERPKIDGAVGDQFTVQVPNITVFVEFRGAGGFLELGTRRQHRFAVLSIYGYARNEQEMRWLENHLREWFDNRTYLDVLDHDAGTLDVVGNIEIDLVTTASNVEPLVSDTQAFEFILNARLRYEV